MFARRKTFWCKRMAVWQLFFCLTLLAFLCRAFIPAGYMPDPAAERGSPFALTLCSMSGPVVVHVDLSEDSHHGHDGHYSGENCPFGLSVVQKLMPGHESPVPVGRVYFHVLALPAQGVALPSLPALGPPLGSRAPPVSVLVFLQA